MGGHGALTLVCHDIFLWSIHVCCGIYLIGI
jgi:hypothetical protein